MMTRYFSQASFHTYHREIADQLYEQTCQALRAYAERNGQLPARLLFYRDGVGDGQLDEVQQREVAEVRSALTDMADKFGQEVPKLGFIVVNRYATILSREEERALKRDHRPTYQGENASPFNLEGAPRIVTQDMYLENVKIPEGASNRQTAQSVMQHAKRNEIDIKFCVVRRNKFASDRVGCKISIPSTQIHRCKNHNIWPLHVTCRDWVPRAQMDSQGASYRGNRQRGPRFARDNYRNTNDYGKSRDTDNVSGFWDSLDNDYDSGRGYARRDYSDDLDDHSHSW